MGVNQETLSRTGIPPDQAGQQPQQPDVRPAAGRPPLPRVDTLNQVDRTRRIEREFNVFTHAAFLGRALHEQLSYEIPAQPSPIAIRTERTNVRERSDVPLVVPDAIKRAQNVSNEQRRRSAERLRAEGRDPLQVWRENFRLTLQEMHQSIHDIAARERVINGDSPTARAWEIYAQRMGLTNSGQAETLTDVRADVDVERYKTLYENTNESMFTIAFNTIAACAEVAAQEVTPQLRIDPENPQVQQILGFTYHLVQRSHGDAMLADITALLAKAGLYMSDGNARQRFLTAVTPQRMDAIYFDETNRTSQAAQRERSYCDFLLQRNEVPFPGQHQATPAPGPGGGQPPLVRPEDDDRLTGRKRGGLRDLGGRIGKGVGEMVTRIVEEDSGRPPFPPRKSPASTSGEDQSGGDSGQPASRVESPSVQQPQKRKGWRLRIALPRFRRRGKGTEDQSVQPPQESVSAGAPVPPSGDESDSAKKTTGGQTPTQSSGESQPTTSGTPVKPGIFTGFFDGIEGVIENQRARRSRKGSGQSSGTGTPAAVDEKPEAVASAVPSDEGEGSQPTNPPSSEDEAKGEQEHLLPASGGSGMGEVVPGLGEEENPAEVPPRPGWPARVVALVKEFNPLKLLGRRSSSDTMESALSVELSDEEIQKELLERNKNYAFHLENLVEIGALTPEYRLPPGETINVALEKERLQTILPLTYERISQYRLPYESTLKTFFDTDEGKRIIENGGMWKIRRAIREATQNGNENLAEALKFLSQDLVDHFYKQIMFDPRNVRIWDNRQPHRQEDAESSPQGAENIRRAQAYVEMKELLVRTHGEDFAADARRARAVFGLPQFREALQKDSLPDLKRLFLSIDDKDLELQQGLVEMVFEVFWNRFYFYDNHLQRQTTPLWDEWWEDGVEEKHRRMLEALDGITAAVPVGEVRMVKNPHPGRDGASDGENVKIEGRRRIAQFFDDLRESEELYGGPSPVIEAALAVPGVRDYIERGDIEHIRAEEKFAEQAGNHEAQIGFRIIEQWLEGNRAALNPRASSEDADSNGNGAMVTSHETGHTNGTAHASGQAEAGTPADPRAREEQALRILHAARRSMMEKGPQYLPYVQALDKLLDSEEARKSIAEKGIEGLPDLLAKAEEEGDPWLAGGIQEVFNWLRTHTTPSASAHAAGDAREVSG